MAVTHGSGLGGGSAISGAGASPRVTLWTGPSTLGSDPNFVYGTLSGGFIASAEQYGVPIDNTGVFINAGRMVAKDTFAISFTDGTATAGVENTGLARFSNGILAVQGYPGTLGHLTGGVLSARHPAAVAAVVTPHESGNGTITAVAGAVLVNHDFFTLNGADVYEFLLALPITIPGAVPIIYDGTETAGGVRDLIITAVNTAALGYTASIGGAAVVNLEMDTPVAGGLNTENVTDGGFAVTGFTVGGASTWGYTIVAKLNDGSVSIGAETQTLVGPADLDANDYNTITWVDNANAFSYDIYRTTVGGPPSALTTGLVAADIASGVQTFNDTGIAAGAALPAVDTTGQVRFYDSGGNYIGFRASETIAANQNFIWPTAAPVVGEALVAATVTGTEIQLDWASAAVTYYTKTLTGGAATDFLDVTVASNTGLGGKLVYEVEAVNDAAPNERNIITGELAFTSLNKNAATLYTDLTDRQDSNVETNATALTLVWAYTNNVGAAKFTISCNASSTLAGTKAYTLRYQVVAPKALTVAAV